MLKLRNVVLPAALLFAALTLSACATKPKEVAAEPAVPVAAAPEKATEPAPAPAIAEQPAPAPVAMAEHPAPKHVVKKHKRKAQAKVAPAPVVAPQPVAAPAPEVKQEAPVAAPPAPAPAAVMAPPVDKAGSGFFEKYWLWLLGIVVIVIAFMALKKKD